MELDLETFLTTLYVMTDDLYVQHIQPHMPPHGGPAAELSDAEVLCLGLAAQVTQGVPWSSERGFLRYAHRHLRPLFPKLISQSAFNRRLRRLWGAFILLQQAIVEAQGPHVCELLDCVPLRQARGARAFQATRMAEFAGRGKGGTDGFFYGYRGLLAVTPDGLITGWILAAGNVQDRWPAELLLSARAGQPQLTGPDTPRGVRQPQPPLDWISPPQSAGRACAGPLVADLGYYGANWQQHWAAHYGATVLTPTFPKQPMERRWFNRLRQGVETVFANLTRNFGFAYPNAHTLSGLLMRTGAKIAACNLLITLNRQLGRPDFAFATLIV